MQNGAPATGGWARYIHRSSGTYGELRTGGQALLSSGADFLATLWIDIGGARTGIDQSRIAVTSMVTLDVAQ